MKFALAKQLQDQFANQCPMGWTCRREHPVLSAEYEDLLGYRPQADVLLEKISSHERIWIELEVSRADPVANHAKFGSAHLIQPFPRTDAFVSMVSRDIVPGRANLAAHAIFMLRSLGLRAFQLPLFPELDSAQIKQLNQHPSHIDSLPSMDIDHLIELTYGVSETDGVEIHRATNIFEVLLNLAQWNRDILENKHKEKWGTRRVKYFVYDPKRGRFGPSKFCAYTLMPPQPTSHFNLITPMMAIPFYVRIDQQNSIFDGQKAWKSLRCLGFNKIPLRDQPVLVRQQFDNWLKSVTPAIEVEINSVEILRHQ